MSSPDLTVCILNWNTQGLLRDCLRSLLDTRQGLGGEVEVMVVDNASEDGSAEMVRQQFAEVTLIQNERNLLYAGGNNVAARQASGRHILFLNTDTVVDCAELAKMVSFMDAHPTAGICGPLQFDGAGNICRLPAPFPSVGSYLCRLLGLGRHRTSVYQAGHPPVPVDVVSGACLLIRADLGRQLGFFDEQFDLYANDTDLCFRARQAGCEVWYLPECYIVHYGGRSTGRMPSDAAAAKTIAAHAAFIGKQYRPFTARLLRALFAAQLYRWVLSRAVSCALSLGRSERRRRRFRDAVQLLRAYRQCP